MPTSADYDVAIIGGGHNGLTAACYLAAEGKKVVVIEALDKAGGMCNSGYTLPQAPQHMIHPCALDLMSLRVHPMVPDELQLARHGFRQERMLPGYVFLHPDGSSLVFGSTPEETAAEIRRYSAKDAEEFLSLMQVVNAFVDMALPQMRVDPARFNFGAKMASLGVLLKNLKLKPEIMGLVSSPAYTTIMERFEHPVTQSALCCLLGAAGPIANEGTGIYFVLLGFVQRFGLGRSIGGMQALSDAFVGRLKEVGGELMLSTRVEEIVAEAGKVKGVRLADGRMLNAKAVIGAIHPKPALEMVTAGEIERKLLTRVALAPANSHGAAPVKVDVALKGQISYKRHEALRGDGVSFRKSGIIFGTAEAVLDNFKCAARGEVSKLPYQWITAPTAMDPSQAPEGQDVAYLYPVAMPVHPTEGWDAIRDEVAQMLIDQAAEYMDGLKEHEIARNIDVPMDWEKKYNVHNGCVVHIDTMPSRSGGMRPAAGLGGDTLPVAGLYLGGAGIAPGGGVNGLPGRITAARVSRYLKK
ncbi:MAG: NAD(P)/FAD-dependent oxidoreductase [Gammaproteobacteria bacterium]|uniref:phytoene desaturase family protein n=1 Tax=Pseudomaricurvus alcaniphilus TaxID=1166482 RepID=UPI00140A9C35|nr:NAD(P)/FAD-dependent oxidoreductase [Pseudomaricurvus alcaniphilus]MBR9909216.1 NAD(P)/FAD-dependent oxidoreductase [Gammaproteobacteria bacterium]NHN38220.1 NAD(P)/FAD-dependent oxidoreductase [Pseudomaricurvus alcaniphilus]